jgi:hypothetical protein
MTPSKIRLAAAAMGKGGTIVADLCKEANEPNALWTRCPRRDLAIGWKTGDPTPVGNFTGVESGLPSRAASPEPCRHVPSVPEAAMVGDM